MRKRLFAIFMVICMITSIVPVSAFAAECEHHLSHTAECGYKEAVAGVDCTHECGEDCSSEADCIHGDNHDESCGYVAAVEGADCIFVCDKCGADPADANSEADDLNAPTAEDCTCTSLCPETLPEEMELTCSWCLADHTQCACEPAPSVPVADEGDGKIIAGSVQEESSAHVDAGDGEAPPTCTGDMSCTLTEGHNEGCEKAAHDAAQTDIPQVIDTAADSADPTVWDGSSVDTAWTGSGTAEDPYMINSAAELAGLAQSVNGGNQYSGMYFKLGADINLDNKSWTPIGTQNHCFYGIFDGDNHTISNLYFNNANSWYVGLFGYTKGGAVKNFTLTNANVTGQGGVGAVAGSPYTSAYSNILVNGHIEINGMAYVGGAMGYMAYNDLTNVDVAGDASSYVYANSKGSRAYVGGLIGFMGEGNITVKDCDVAIKVTGTTCNVGGLMGILQYNNTLINCTYTGTVTLEAPDADPNPDTNCADEFGALVGTINNDTNTKTQMLNCTFTGTAMKDAEDVTSTIPASGDLYNNSAGTNSLYVAEATVNNVATVDTNAAASVAGTYYLNVDDAITAAVDSNKTVTVWNDVILTTEQIESIQQNNIKVDPNGNKVTDADGGTVEWPTSGVAEVNGTGYATIDEALAAWKDNGGTLKLLDNVTTGATVDIVSGKTYTFDLNGKTMTYSASSTSTALFKLGTGADLTVTNGYLIHAKGKIVTKASGAENTALVLNGVSVTTTYTSSVNFVTVDKFSMTNSSMVASKANTSGLVYIYGDSTIQNSTIKTTTSGKAIKVTGSAVLTISGDETEITEVSNDTTVIYAGGTSSVVINGGKFVGKYNVDNSATVTINGGTVTGNYALFTSTTAKFVVKEELKDTLGENKLDSNLKSGYIITSTTADGMTTYQAGVHPETAQAKIGSTLYATFKEAMDAARVANDNAPIVLLQDIEGDYTFRVVTNSTEPVSYTVDLNGHAIKGNITAYAYTTNRPINLTFVDNSTNGGGKIDGSGKVTAVNVYPGATVTIGEGVTVIGGNNGIFVGYDDNNSSYNGLVATVNVYGTVTVAEETGICAITSNGTPTNCSTAINIYDGAVVSGKALAIYHPQAGTLNVSGGTIAGGTGIYMKSGDLTVTGGTIKGIGEAVDYKYEGSGCTATGDAVVIDNCGYPGGEPSANITGGTFESANNKQIGAYFHATETNNVTGVAEVNSTNTSLSIPEGYKWDENGKLVEDKKVYVAEVSGQKYEDLQAAINAAQSGETVKLLADIENMSRIVLNGKSAKIDLNGHTISSASGTQCFGVINGATLELTGTGTVKESNPYYAPILFQCGTSENVTTVTIGENVTLEGWTGIMIDQGGNGANTTARLTVNMNGKVISHNDKDGYSGSGIYINGNISDTTTYPTINIGSTAVLNGGEGAGIHAAGYAVWNVEGTVTGATAIHAQSGVVNVKPGAVLTANGEKKDYVPGNNGITITGDAIVSDNCGYPGGAPVINITGGTITSANGKQVGAYFGNTATEIGQVTSTNTTLTVPENYKWSDEGKLIAVYTITYELDGGSVATENPTSYTIEDEAITLNNPEKPGYTFAGWMGTDLDEASTSVTIAKGSSGNRTYTATWNVKTYTVTFDANGGEGTMAVLTHEGTFTLPECTFVAPDGKQFKGWASSAAGDVYTETELTVSENITLYAIWENTDHVHGNGVLTEAVDPDCGTGTNGSKAYYTCSCGQKYYDAACTKPVLDAADLVVQWSHTGGTATCAHKAKCAECGQEYGELGSHGETEIRDAKAATCAAEGYTGDTYCKDCGVKLESGKAIAKTAHTYKNGKCTVCKTADPNYNSDVPATGDNELPVLWFSLFVVSALGAIAALIPKRKKGKYQR